MSDTTSECTATSQEILVNEPATIQRAARGRFAAGNSANPLGRPRGARGRTAQAIESLMDGEAELLTRKIIEQALSGDTNALKFCIERLLPRMKARPMNIDMPLVERPADIAAALTAIVDAAACGDIDADQAHRLAATLALQRQNFEVVELESRLNLVERKVSRDDRAI